MKISLHHIHKSYGNKSVIRDVSLIIDDASFTTLLGSSGCGKTTLLRIISGLECPDSGEVYFDDRCMFSQSKGINISPEKRGLGFVFQDFSLWPHMTAFENVAFGLRATGHTENLEEKVTTALHAVQLDDKADCYPHQLQADSNNAYPSPGPSSSSRNVYSSMNPSLRWTHCYVKECASNCVN